MLSSMSGFGGAMSAQAFSDTPMSSSSGGESDYRYASSVQQMLAWPAMQQLKMHAMDPSVDRDGPGPAIHPCQAASAAVPNQVGRNYHVQHHMHADSLVMTMESDEADRGKRVDVYY